MATTKKTEETVEETKTEEIAGERMVTVNIPLGRDEDDGYEFVSVNERTWMIRKGEDVEVPECVAEVLRTARRAKRDAIVSRRAKQK